MVPAVDQCRAHEVGEVGARQHVGRDLTVLEVTGEAEQREADRPPLLRRARAPARDTLGLVGVVGRQAVAQVVPGDQRHQGVDPRVERCGRELVAAAVGPADGAHARVDGPGPAVVVDRVVDDDLHRRRGLRVSSVEERDARRAAEVADQLAAGLAVPVGVVEGDLAAGAAEAEPGVGQDDIAAPCEGLAEGGLVVLGTTEAVGREDRGHPVGLRRRGRHVDVAHDVADLVVGRTDHDPEVQRRHRVRGPGRCRPGAGRNQRHEGQEEREEGGQPQVTHG